MARTQKFATETADLPAREGERVTIAAAAPSNVFREVGPIKFSPKDPNFYSGEPMSLTNHSDGRESLLLRVPAKGTSSLLNPSTLFPLIVFSAAGDAASGVIDPSLPRLLLVAGFASLAAGATLNSLILPQFNRVQISLVTIFCIAYLYLNLTLFFNMYTDSPIIFCIRLLSLMPCLYTCVYLNLNVVNC